MNDFLKSAFITAVFPIELTVLIGHRFKRYLESIWVNGRPIFNTSKLVKFLLGPLRARVCVLQIARQLKSPYLSSRIGYKMKHIPTRLTRRRPMHLEGSESQMLSYCSKDAIKLNPGSVSLLRHSVPSIQCSLSLSLAKRPLSSLEQLTNLCGSR